jgi:hypothetical protein
MGEDSKVYKVLVGEPKRKRPLARPRRKWEDRIRMYLREIGWGVQWIQFAQGMGLLQAPINTGMNLRVLEPLVSFHNLQKNL